MPSLKFLQHFVSKTLKISLKSNLKHTKIYKYQQLKYSIFSKYKIISKPLKPITQKFKFTNNNNDDLSSLEQLDKELSEHRNRTRS